MTPTDSKKKQSAGDIASNSSEEGEIAENGRMRHEQP
jgi:hypothetical protein